jgi:hypothetical protein
MSDVFDDLARLADAQPAGPSLAADEVRRRGDRMRRRRGLFQAAGATLAVAVVVGGGFAATGALDGKASPEPPAVTQLPSPDPDRDGTPSPAPTEKAPSGSGQATSVPKNFPLLADVPAPDGDSKRTAHDDPARPALFDPCHNNDSAATTGRTALRQVAQTGPAQAYLREIVVYQDSTSADAAMQLARRELERCPTYSYDDGVSADRWEDGPLSTEEVSSDEAIMAVSHGTTDGRDTTLATHYLMARVGNAIVTLAYDGEFGASAGSTRAVARHDVEAYRTMTPAMCAFADETSVSYPCDGTKGIPGPDPEVAQPLGVAIDEHTLRSTTHVAFRPVAATQSATLACQAEWLSTLEPEEAEYREFEKRATDGTLAAWAGAAELRFADTATADDAFRTVTGWLSDCTSQVDSSHRRVTVGDNGLGTPHENTVLGLPSYWRGVKLTAPERCTECDAAWDDHQGVLRVGQDRLLLAHVAYGGDMQLGVDDSRSPMDRLLLLAARTDPANTGG